MCAGPPPLSLSRLLLYWKALPASIDRVGDKKRTGWGKNNTKIKKKPSNSPIVAVAQASGHGTDRDEAGVDAVLARVHSLTV